MTTDEYKGYVFDRIILELRDDALESNLLGIRADIDLEDENKSTCDK